MNWFLPLQSSVDVDVHLNIIPEVFSQGGPHQTDEKRLTLYGKKYTTLLLSAINVHSLYHFVGSDTF